MKTNLQKVVDFLWANRESYKDQIRNGEVPLFDSPDYSNLPKELLNEMFMEEINVIQDIWTEFVGWNVEHGTMVIGFKNKKEFYSAIKKRIKEQIEKEKKEYPVILGDFIAWAIENKYWIRGFESITRTKSEFGPNGESGWSFLWATQCGFVSDKDIRKKIKAKTSEEWIYWGR